MNFQTTSSISREPDEIIFTIHKFPTHVRTRKPSSKKGGAQIKVNGQTLYSGLHYAVRNKVVGSLRKSITDELIKHFPGGENLHHLVPMAITMEWHVTPNWETVKWSNKHNTLQCKDLEDRHYNGMFDTDNQWFWLKVFTDAISKDSQLVPEDKAPIIPNNGSIKHFPVEHIDDRKLVFKLKKINDV